jgi:hypothetical protein
MFDLFKLVNEVPYTPHESSDNPDDSMVKSESELSEVTKFKISVATLCSCVLAYAQYNNQQNPDNPQDTLRKTIVFCDKLMQENLLSQQDTEHVMNEVKGMIPLSKPSLCKRMIAQFCKMYQQHVPMLFDENESNVKEEFEGKIDKYVNNAVNKALVLCGSNRGFRKFLGVDQPEQEAVYIKEN